jgi:hypothetical protein
LPLFLIETVSVDNSRCVLAEVQTEAKRILGSFELNEYDALKIVNLPNGGHLNHFFEQMGVAYAPRLLPRTKAFQAAREKRKAKVSKKPTAKRVKTASDWVTPSKTVPPKKIGIMKLVQPKAKLEPQGMSEMELAPAKPVGVSKKFCLLDAPSSSHGPRDSGLATTKVGERTARVVAFDNLGDDSSPDVRETPMPPKD